MKVQRSAGPFFYLFRFVCTLHNFALNFRLSFHPRVYTSKERTRKIAHRFMITLNDLDSAIRQLAFSNGSGMVQRRVRGWADRGVV